MCIHICVLYVCVVVLSCLTIWSVACQDPLSMEFFKKEYLSELPFPLSGDVLNPGVEPMFPVSPILAFRFFATEPPG